MLLRAGTMIHSFHQVVVEPTTVARHGSVTTRRTRGVLVNRLHRESARCAAERDDIRPLELADVIERLESRRPSYSHDCSPAFPRSSAAARSKCSARNGVPDVARSSRNLTALVTASASRSVAARYVRHGKTLSEPAPRVLPRGIEPPTSIFKGWRLSPTETPGAQ